MGAGRWAIADGRWALGDGRPPLGEGRGARGSPRRFVVSAFRRNVRGRSVLRFATQTSLRMSNLDPRLIRLLHDSPNLCWTLAAAGAHGSRGTAVRTAGTGSSSPWPPSTW